jgi:hypothetical protein
MNSKDKNRQLNEIKKNNAGYERGIQRECLKNNQIEISEKKSSKRYIKNSADSFDNKMDQVN